MTDNLNITGPDKGSTDAGSNSPVDAAVKDANSSMSFEPVGDGTVVCPSTASAPPGMKISQEKSHWIAIELVDEHGKPVPGEEYRITLPDGSVVEDCLDSKGKARIDGIDAGACKITFPSLDMDLWS